MLITIVKNTCRIILVLALTVLGNAQAFAVSEEFLQDCEALTKDPHRLTGTDEYQRAAEYVKVRLRQIGIDESDIMVQDFQTAQTRVKRCEIEIQTSSSGTPVNLSLQPIRPNGIIPPVTPEAGISGPLFYAGSGEITQYQDRSPKGCIVVLDYNAGSNWLKAFRLGARAVIFVPNGTAQSRATHFVIANANLPRYYYPGKLADLPDGITATIHSEIVWESVAGQNIFAFLRGRNPKFNTEKIEKEEMLIMAAHLDSFGEVPRLSPGARSAVNCAGLLKLVRYFKANPVRRHILFAFFDAQCRGHAGSSAFYRAVDVDKDFKKQLGIEERQASFDNEREFFEKIESALGDSELSKQGLFSDIAVINKLKDKAEQFAIDVKEPLFDLRRQRARIKDKDSRPHQAIQAEIEKIEVVYKQWSDLRRALRRGNITDDAREKFDVVVKAVRSDNAQRQKEFAAEENALKCDARLRKTLGNYWISLHVSLLLGDATPAWGLIIGSDSDMKADDPGYYKWVRTAFLDIAQSIPKTRPMHFETATADHRSPLNPPRMLMTAPYVVHSGEIAGALGFYNLALGTCQESLPREGTPDDVLSKLNLERMEQQISEISLLFRAAANHEGLSLTRSIKAKKSYAIPKFTSGYKIKEPLVLGKVGVRPVYNKHMADVTVQLGFNQTIYNPAQLFQSDTEAYKKIYAFDNFQVVRSNHNGTFMFGPVHTTLVGFAIKTDERGLVTYATTGETSASSGAAKLYMFACRSGLAILPPRLTVAFTQGIDVLGGTTDSKLDVKDNFFATLDGLVYWYCQERIKKVKLFKPGHVVRLGNSNEMADADKEIGGAAPGVTMDSSQEPSNITCDSARDLWFLNESRLRVLRASDIMNNSIEELHGLDEDLLIASEKADSAIESEALAASSFLTEKTVYTKIKNTFDDLVLSVLILLILTVPFAFALERLLVGATSIYNQIFWFAAFFTTTFVVLFFTHPAFAISSTPIIIFLGFTVVLLSTVVIVIIMQKFEVELKTLQGMTSTVHAIDVSRFATMLAAMKMGISTMRRRPLRTTLTTVTITLLTFTILCFASFGTETGIIRIFLRPSPKHTGIFIHDINWKKLSPDMLDVMRTRWGQDTTICPRYWRTSSLATENNYTLITHPDGSHPWVLKGTLGIDPVELKYRPELKRLFEPGSTAFGEPRLEGWEEDFDQTVWMTEAMAKELDVRPGDQVLVNGLLLTVGNTLSTSQVILLEDMDGSSILPVDFVYLSFGQTYQSTTSDEDNTTVMPTQSNWTVLPVDAVVMVSSNTARRMGASLYAITLYTKSSGECISIAEDLARMLRIPVSATRTDGVYFHILGTTLQASGARNLFFPILLGGLIILGTMLGSVADREREIYTFSALGLGPPHITSLFFAEAMVYAIIGGLGGYLIAQGTMKVFSCLAGYGIVPALEMNYSSTNTVITLLIVMATVLLSSIYPALKASRSANPGIMRYWRLPPPKQDVFDIVFPFTVSEYDMTGIVSFLKEHFDNFADTSVGIFMAKNARLIKSGKQVGLDSYVALAPFDLGVTQLFELRSRPSEIAGINEVTIKLTRQSGQPKDWQRLNKILLGDLRRQFLIWRSLSQEVMETYRQHTLTEFGALSKENGK